MRGSKRRNLGGGQVRPLSPTLYLDGIPESVKYEDRGALRGTPGSAYPQPEPNATELPSSAPGRPKLIKLHASAPSPTPTRAEEHIATTPDCRLRALARRRAPKRTSHYTCWCERNTLRETLGALATWVPATAMLPLPLALSLSLTSPWQQHHCSLSAPRRSAGTAAAARSCGVVVCCDRDDVPS